MATTTISARSSRFYDATDPGGGSSNPIVLTTGPLGYVYVSNTSTDTIMKLKDLNGDGDADDAGEATVYIDLNNGSGVLFSSIFGMAFDTNGDLYIVNSSSGAAVDFIGLCKDLNADGDCNDAGEISILYDSPTAIANGVIELYVPMPCVLMPDGWLVVSDVNDPNGNDVLVRMKDLNGDGDLYDANEVDYFYDDTVGPHRFQERRFHGPGP